ncbi:CoA pyrophosphatase [Flavobacterium sp.]|uniref:NUDIX hydrolase n=1 Tax=Flavobacterium sp. TaxID=239 RepID=UPI002639BDB9|nr:CoA pyrophosphatase [Flavobacterium sp.]MDD3003932.1 CoA pyrophosphatase [Flavobacterium sp.]
MIFADFLNYIPKIAKEKLLCDEAHEKLSPPERISFLKTVNSKDINSRKAAVLMLFYPKMSLTHLVLIVRNSYAGVHSSQIGFPGGKIEEFDHNSEATALRETYEEIGVLPDQVNIVRAFSELYIPPSNFTVYPYMGYSNDTLVFTPDPREVFEIIELPLSDLLEESNFTHQIMETSYMKQVKLPVFKFGENIVWGATGMMLSELKEVLKKVL